MIMTAMIVTAVRIAGSSMFSDGGAVLPGAGLLAVLMSVSPMPAALWRRLFLQVLSFCATLGIRLAI